MYDYEFMIYILLIMNCLIFKKYENEWICVENMFLSLNIFFFSLWSYGDLVIEIREEVGGYLYVDRIVVVGFIGFFFEVVEFFRGVG